MNKKAVLLLGLFLVVGALLVFGQDTSSGCGSDQNTPCQIGSNSATRLEANKWYTFPGSQPFQATGAYVNQEYVYRASSGIIEPIVPAGSSGTVRYADGTGREIPFLTVNSVRGTSTPATSPQSGSTTMINVNGEYHELTLATLDQFNTDCLSDYTACTITGTNTYTTPTETVIVRDDAVIRRNTERASITSGGSSFEMTSDQYDNLPLNLAGADTLSLGQGSLAYTVGDRTETLVDKGWGIEVQDAAQNVIRLLVGDEIIEEENGEWAYGGRTYSNYDSEEGTLNAPGITLAFGTDAAGRQQITETSGTQSTTTIFTDQGEITEIREDGDLISRSASDETGRTIWENAINTDGEITSTTFYNEQRRPSGWCSRECDNPEYTFDWNSPQCYGQFDNTACYSGSGRIPSGFMTQVYDDQLWNGEASDDYLDAGRALFGHPLSFYALANEWEWYDQWIKDVDAFFASTYLQEEPFVSALCEIDIPIIFSGAPTGLGIIRTPRDTYQSVGHVVAERIPVGPLVCDDEGNCPANLECHEDQFCYQAGEREPTGGFLYKIDWGVTAPSDEFLIGGGSAAGGQSIKFNLVLYDTLGRERFLFADAAGRATRDTLSLEKGERSASTYAPLIAEYSPETFTKICIEWSDQVDFVPHTIDPTIFHGADPLRLPYLCDDEITEVGKGRTLEAATDPTGVSQSRTIRYCTLSGCS